MSDDANAYLQSVYAQFPEARLRGLGITDPLIGQYKASWDSQSPDWKFATGVNWASQSDSWVVAALPNLPSPLAVKALAFIGPNPPPNPKYDDLWYDDAHEALKRWSGSGWVTGTGGTAGVTSVNGLAGAVTITATGLGAVLASSLGVNSGVAQLDATGKTTLAQSRVSSVAGRIGAVVLTAADISGVVLSSSIGVSGGVASLDSTGRLPSGQLPANYLAGVVLSSSVGVSGGVARLNSAGLVVNADGSVPAGTGGGGTGGAVTSVAGRTGAVVLTTADVTNAASLDPATSRLTLTQVPQKFSATLMLPGTATIASMFPGGYPSPYPSTLAYAVLTSSRAPLGSGTSVLLRQRVHSTQAFTTLATVPLPTGVRRVVTALTTAINAWDTLHARVTALGGSEPGGDLAVTYVGVGATAPPGMLAAPTAPTGLTVTATSSTSNTLSWTAPASGIVTNYHVYRSDPTHALAWIGDTEAPTTSLLDASTTTGVAYTYQVTASNEDAAGPSVTSASAGFTYFSQAAGTLSTSSWTTYLGSNTGTSSTVDASGNWVITSGNAGANAPQDPVVVQWAETGNPTYSAMRIIMHIKWGAAADIMNIYMTANNQTSLTSTWTTGYQIQLQPGNHRVALKAPTYTPPGLTAGAFYNLTNSTTSPAQATSVAANGTVPWTVGTMALNTEYILTFEILGWTSGGPQTMNIYLSTLAGSPVLQNTITINATQRAAIPAGFYIYQFLGNQVTAGQQNSFTIPSPLQMVPLSTAGT